MLSPLPGGLQQSVPGHKPAYGESVTNAEFVELSLKLAQLPGKKNWEKTQLLRNNLSYSLTLGEG